MQNVEFKAELRDLPLARSIALASRALHAQTIQQTDTYFKLADSRLKRREIVIVGAPTADAEPAIEFIHYDRENRSRPKLSRFTIYTAQQAADRYGATLPSVWLIVRKIREVYLIDGVRIHLDTVESLGTYIEFEAPITPDRNIPAGYAALDSLRALFRPALGEPIDCSYSDLLAPD